MTAASLSDEADALYRPLGGLEPWLAAAVDERAWENDVGRMRAWREEGTERMAMLDRGAQLAAAHRSAAASGQVPDDDVFTGALLGGEVSLAPLPGPARAHVVANYRALVLARSAPGPSTEDRLRQVHAVACRPQATYRVVTGRGEDDHVLAHGDYKHHPNHIRQPDGAWRATAPVARLAAEMARYAEALDGPDFAAMPPVAQAAFVLHGLAHVAPFEAGNGRVGRAVASAHLLRAGGPPLVGRAEADDPASLVELVGRRCTEAVERIGQAVAGPPPGAAAGWRRRSQAAAELVALLPVAVQEALARHATRPRPAWQADLAGASAVGSGDGAVIRVPVGASTIDEAVVVDAHPLEGGDEQLDLAAAGAGLAQPVYAGSPGADLAPWLDRVVTALAVRVAAALE